MTRQLELLHELAWDNCQKRGRREAMNVLEHLPSDYYVQTDRNRSGHRRDSGNVDELGDLMKQLVPSDNQWPLAIGHVVRVDFLTFVLDGFACLASPSSILAIKAIGSDGCCWFNDKLICLHAR